MTECFKPSPADLLRTTTDALANMLGAYDTPVSRRRYPPDEFMKECISSAKTALQASRDFLEGKPVSSQSILTPDEADAARYRWLRNQSFETWKSIGWNTWGGRKDAKAIVAEDRDRKIDEAMSADSEQITPSPQSGETP